MSLLMDNDFPRWLEQQRLSRDWSQSDLARAAKINRQVVSDYEGYKRKNFDETILRKLARALKMSPEQIFRIAGLLPPKPDQDEWVDEMSHKLNMIPAGMRGVASRFIESVISNEEPKPKPRKATSTK